MIRPMKICLALIIALVCISFTVHVVMRARQNAMFHTDATYTRAITQSLVVYASNNENQFPQQEHWVEELLEGGFADLELLASPGGVLGVVPYTYVPGPYSYDSKQVLIYQDPHRWPKRGVLVGFADNHAETVSFDEFELMLEKQLQQEVAP
jgi:hypothetical protein